MRNLHPRVAWQTGDVLTAEHLLAQDRYFDSLIRFHTASQPWPFWGFSKLEIDRTKLEQGELSLIDASGVFPDGLAFDIPTSDGTLHPVRLAQYAQKEQGVLHVFLAIPIQDDAKPADEEDADNVGFEQGSHHRRFLEVIGGVDGAVPFLRKNFRLLVLDPDMAYKTKSDETVSAGQEGNEQATWRKVAILPRGYSSLQLARITYSSSKFQIDEAFVPPIVDISASRRIATEVAANLLETMKQKSADLARGFSPFRSIEASTMNVVEIGRLSYLLVLNEHLPLLRSLCQSMDYTTGEVAPRGHPYELYRQLLSLASSLLAFAPFMGATDLRHYDHSNLERTFDSLNQVLTQLLDIELLGNSLTFKLRQVPGMTRLAQTDGIDPRYFANTSIYIAVYGREKEGSLTLSREMLRGVDFSWVPAGAVSQLAFANPIQAAGREEPNCLRRRNYSYHPIPHPRESDLTTEMRLQAKWSEGWKEIELELVFVFPLHERTPNPSALRNEALG